MHEMSGTEKAIFDLMVKKIIKGLVVDASNVAEIEVTHEGDDEHVRINIHVAHLIGVEEYREIYESTLEEVKANGVQG